jgi:hypothetical protein
MKVDRVNSPRLPTLSGTGGLGGSATYATGGGTPATTVTDETTYGITPDVGTDTEYARQDHTHGSPPDPATVGFVGALLISDTHSTPLVFDDILQNDDGDDFLYADI